MIAPAHSCLWHLTTAVTPSQNAQCPQLAERASSCSSGQHSNAIYKHPSIMLCVANEWILRRLNKQLVLIVLKLFCMRIKYRPSPDWRGLSISIAVFKQRTGLMCDTCFFFSPNSLACCAGFYHIVCFYKMRVHLRIFSEISSFNKV